MWAISPKLDGLVHRSARVLGALGYSVEVIDPAHGLSLRGTSDDKLFSGDVVRKALGPDGTTSGRAPADASAPSGAQRGGQSA